MPHTNVNAGPRIIRVAISACAGAVFAACTVGPADANSDDAAAVIVAPTERSRAVLQRAVSQALKRESVLIADDALTADDVLTIEPARVRDATGGLVTDNSVRIEQFRLVKQQSSCVLVHVSTGNRYTLADTKCVVKP